jgi:hypothetical protein
LISAQVNVGLFKESVFLWLTTCPVRFIDFLKLVGATSIRPAVELPRWHFISFYFK